MEQPELDDLYDELNIYQTYELSAEHIQLNSEMEGVTVVDEHDVHTASELTIATVDNTMLHIDNTKIDDETFSVTGLYILDDYTYYWPVNHSYEFKKEDGVWKLNKWEIKFIEEGDRNFNLTEEEVVHVYSSVYGTRFKLVDEYGLPTGESVYKLTSIDGYVFEVLVLKQTDEPIY